MRSALLLIALPSLLAFAPGAQAIEPFKIYDRFSDKPIDPARWQDTERIRVIKGGGLQLMQRTWGTADSDAGITAMNWSSNFANPQTITSIKARVTVNALEANACPSNPTAADSRARVIGGFFNVGVPTPGSQVGDAIAQVRLIRISNTTDPAGLLHVQGILSICTTADCAGASTVGNVVDLGTVTIGTAATVQLQWDKPGKTFYFSRDGAGSGTVAYAQSDANPPSSPFRQLSTRVNLPNCQSAPRVSGLVDAKFDNVSVNQSAIP
jgi:hypothetical protein